MFVLAEMQDAVRIEPHRFSHDMSQELTDELNKKFANKVDFLGQKTCLCDKIIYFFHSCEGCA